jgi:large subunit ribosomal protein L2
LYGYVQTIEYDPFRSSFIFSFYQKETVANFYLLAPQTIKKNNLIYSGSKPILSKLTIGSYLPLKVVPIGSIIYNLEIIENKGSQYIKSAGTFAKVLKKSRLTNLAEVLLTSGEKRLVKLDCYASLGSCSNPNKRFTTIGKAGRSRWLGIRPTTRGVAMNPVDHPHGGGNIHKVQKTPWGKYAKGPRTAKKKRKTL